jgi:hypothetical protein
MRMNMFAVQEKAKSHTENIISLILALVKPTTVQVTSCRCSIKYDRHDLLYKAGTDKGLVYSAKRRSFNNKLYVRYVYLTKGQAYS